MAAYRLAGAKPLSEPMVEYCLIDPWEQTWNLNRNSYILIHKMRSKMPSGKMRPFCFGLNTSARPSLAHIIMCHLIQAIMETSASLLLMDPMEQIPTRFSEIQNTTIVILESKIRMSSEKSWLCCGSLNVNLMIRLCILMGNQYHVIRLVLIQARRKSKL